MWENLREVLAFLGILAIQMAPVRQNIGKIAIKEDRENMREFLAYCPFLKTGEMGTSAGQMRVLHHEVFPVFTVLVN